MLKKIMRGGRNRRCERAALVALRRARLTVCMYALSILPVNHVNRLEKAGWGVISSINIALFDAVASNKRGNLFELRRPCQRRQR